MGSPLFLSSRRLAFWLFLEVPTVPPLALFLKHCLNDPPDSLGQGCI